MLDDDLEHDDPESVQDIFVDSFLKGCSTFIFIAMNVKGIEGDSGSVVSNMLKEITGNRNQDNVDIKEIIPQLYEKVITYCNEAVEIAHSHDERRIEEEFEKYKKTLS